jgi:hypothetical protein
MNCFEAHSGLELQAMSKRPSTRTPNREDYLNLSKAFEGLAGALHDGHPIDRADLDAAVEVAHNLWPIKGGGRTTQEQGFEYARLECRTCIPLAVEGDMQAWAQLQKACHEMGQALQWRARAYKGEEAAEGAADADLIRKLDRKYARYARPQVAYAQR